MPPTQFWSLVDIQARMALRADASRMLLGYLWWVLEPLLYVAVFYVVFALVLQTGRENFLLFLVVGKFPFMWFSGSVNLAASSIVAAKGLIGQTRLPKILFPLAKVQEGAYRQSVVFLLLLVAVWAFGTQPGLHWFWLLPIAAVQYLLILACAPLAALLVCVARDFTRVVQLGTLFLLFVSGIFWDVRAIPSETSRDLLLMLNPLAFLLDAYRQVLMYGGAPDWLHLGVLGGTCLLACYLVFSLTARLEYWIASRVLST